MKITKEEFQRIGEESPLELFHQGIKAKETREKYTRTLRHVLCKIFEDILEGDFEERVKQFVKHAKEDPDWTRDLLLNLSMKLKERTILSKEDSDYLNPSSIDNYFKPIKKLFDMNGVVISWNRVYATFPEQDNVSDSRGWTRDEIQKMLKFANGSIDRAIILVSASSGIRAGGFDLNWQDLTPVYQVDDQLKFEITESEEDDAVIVCAMLKIYQGTSFNYPAFITPEAYEALMDYKSDWTREIGREPKEQDPIFKKEGTILRRTTPIGVKKRVERMIKKAGLRDKIKGKRYEVPIMNGFRRFWNKTCKESLSKDSPLGSLIKKEFMMGHTGLIKLDRNYFKTHTLELAEEYLNAIPNLTISNEKRLRLENKKKTEKIEKLEKQQREIDNLKLQVKRIDAKSKMNEAMKKRLIQWAEENPDRADALQMAKIGSHAMNLDEFVEHFVTENHGELEEFLESISKTKISIADEE
ncbi:MAG: integrase [Nitrosopumilus sp.]|uniref:integrase n=1 Tax=Nitrosopumilus sp. TaxID=2024843 RepID=UPI00247059C2|nr:integrase [Nitrosopumilus sp.]MDH5431117.1 integrase [Nitrosopumilus sp.]